MLYADTYFDLNVGSADGTTVTPAILDTGTINPLGQTWSVSPDPMTATALTVGPSYQALRDSITVNSVVYPPSHASRSFVLDMDFSFVRALFGIPAAKRQATFSGMLQMNCSSGSLTNLVDLGGVFGLSSGRFAMMQINNSPFGLNIETNPGGVTTHTASFTTQVTGTWYWYTFLVDYTGGISKLNVYTLDGTLRFSTSGAQETGEDMDNWRMGNGEAGTQAGVTTNFQHLLITYSNVWPQTPSGPILFSPIRRGNRLRRRFPAQLD